MVKDNMRDNRPSQDDQFVQRVHEILSPTKKEHGEAIYDLFAKVGRKDLGRQAWKAARTNPVDALRYE